MKESLICAVCEDVIPLARAQILIEDGVPPQGCMCIKCKMRQEEEDAQAMARFQVKPHRSSRTRRPVEQTRF